MARASSQKSSTASRRSGTLPVSARDHKMSVRHLKESVAFNAAHAKDHKDAEKADRKQLKAVVKEKKKIASGNRKSGVRGS